MRAQCAVQPIERDREQVLGQNTGRDHLGPLRAAPVMMNPDQHVLHHAEAKRLFWAGPVEDPETELGEYAEFVRVMMRQW